jgi:thioredoxin 1
MEVKLTDANFEQEVIKSDKPVLVDFWAEWCGPCLMLGPVIEKLAEDMGNKVKVGKLNVDENQTISQKYQIMSIPTVFLFKGGEIVEQIVGVQPQQVYEQAIEKHS